MYLRIPFWTSRHASLGVGEAASVLDVGGGRLVWGDVESTYVVAPCYRGYGGVYGDDLEWLCNDICIGVWTLPSMAWVTRYYYGGSEFIDFKVVIKQSLHHDHLDGNFLIGAPWHDVWCCHEYQVWTMQWSCRKPPPTRIRSLYGKFINVVVANPTAMICTSLPPLLTNSMTWP